MEIDCSHYVILVCDPGHASYTALWEELGLRFVRNTFLGSDSELACPWFGFLPDSHHSIFQVLQQLFLKLTALPADSFFSPVVGIQQGVIHYSQQLPCSPHALTGNQLWWG